MLEELELERLIENDKNFVRLTNGHISHAILFVSIDELYSLTFAKQIASEILKKNGRDDLAQKVMHKTFVDMSVLSGSTPIKVAEINDIVDKSVEKGIESDFKFCIITRADRMTTEAQNKLLKTLEEPTQNQYFFLCVPSRFLLLPTIVSRCTIIELPEYRPETIKLLIKNSGASDSDSLTAAEQSMGSVEIAQTLLSDSDPCFDIAIDAICNINSSSDCIQFATKIQKESIDKIITYQEQLIVDALKLKYSSGDIWFSSKLEELKKLSNCSHSGLVFIYNKIQEIKELIKVNVSQTVLADKLTLSIAEGKHKQ